MNDLRTFTKAAASVLKDIHINPKIVCFEHPSPTSDFQIPKGTVDKGEDLEEAVLRELYEESGLYDCEVVDLIGELEVVRPGGNFQELEDERQIWKLFHIRSKVDLPAKWEHVVTGDGLDAGMTYKYFWYSLDQVPDERLDKVFVEVFERVKEYIKELKIVQ